jgi:hypothetical protein
MNTTLAVPRSLERHPDGTATRSSCFTPDLETIVALFDELLGRHGRGACASGTATASR